MSPVELQRLRRFILDTAIIEAISDEMRAVVEAVWPELVHKLPLKKPVFRPRSARQARPYSSLGCKTPAAYAEISPQPAITLRCHG